MWFGRAYQVRTYLVRRYTFSRRNAGENECTFYIPGIWYHMIRVASCASHCLCYKWQLFAQKNDTEAAIIFGYLRAGNQSFYTRNSFL